MFVAEEVVVVAELGAMQKMQAEPEATQEVSERYLTLGPSARKLALINIVRYIANSFLSSQTKLFHVFIHGNFGEYSPMHEHRTL